MNDSECVDHVIEDHSERAQFIASYIALKREEQEAFEATPCPIEFQMYYSV